MFTANPNLERLADEIFIYPNFLSAEECSAIVSEVESNPEQTWANTEHYAENKEVIPYLQVVNGSSLISSAHERLSNLVAPDFEPLPSNSINRLLVGQSLQAHWDSPGEDEQISAEIDDPYQTCHIVKYGTVIYLSEFTGGEIYYTKQNIEYRPNIGDLVIHSSMEPYEHGVREVTSGVRYVYSTFLIQKGRVELPKLLQLQEAE